MKHVSSAFLFIATIAVNAAVAQAFPRVEDLNLNSHAPIITSRTERTIASITCEGASNGLPKADLRMNAYYEVSRSASRYSPAEFKVVVDRVVKASESCNPRNIDQLTANK